ncbi:GNAT family N-acetyltransferase [Arachidicoccus terrestris]|uniref:GNAT family N-acetyltransferase n=1 Tax=Arachidicoccus terrestris TaxID=2875539 RepID=UPI001CC63578|nr:GNAT family N-acetyltransferase [Arachidicoccus terrestris]UAY54684.1 GNAT family N-acetyltransferase [Arachidicoccus terrestris]
MPIIYAINKIIPIDTIIEVFDSSGINRPTGDMKRIESMFKAADLTVSAWDGDQLVGIARSLTDFCYCCYLSDLAVRKEYQHEGIGKELVRRTRLEIGPQSMLLLLAAPSAVAYYPKLGMEKMDRAFIFNRETD